jgi:hypothetical protein
MTKLLIEIEIDDVNDPYQCAEALRGVFAALREHHSHEAFCDILTKYALLGMTEDAWQAMQRFDKACSKYPPDERRLVLEYCAMDKPSKLGLAKILAQRNQKIPPAERYCRGSTSETTMLQQIKRVFKKGGIDEIAAGSPELRASYLRSCEYSAKQIAEYSAKPTARKKRRRKW